MCVGPELMAVIGVSKAAAGTAAIAASAGMAALQIGGIAMTAMGQKRQAESQANLAKYNAQVAANDRIAAQQASAAEEKKFRRDMLRFSGRQRAAAAATGGELLDMGDVMAESERNLEMDALAIRHGGLQAQRQAIQRGQIATFSGQQARRAGAINVGSTLLTGASRGIQSAARGASMFGGGGNVHPDLQKPSGF